MINKETTEYSDIFTLENEEENKVIKIKNEDIYLGRRAGMPKGKFTIEDLEVVDKPIKEEEQEQENDSA